MTNLSEICHFLSDVFPSLEVTFSEVNRLNVHSDLQEVRDASFNYRIRWRDIRCCLYLKDFLKKASLINI